MKISFFEPTSFERPLFTSIFLTLVVFFIRIILINLYGVDVPFSDQWDGLVERLYEPFVNHQLTLNHLFLPANEHRVVFMRLLNLFVFILNKNVMNHIMEISAQALVISAAVGCVFFQMCKGRSSYISLLITALVMSAPISWENDFWSYQSQVFFLILFSILGFFYIIKPQVPIFPIAGLSILAGINVASGFLVPFFAAIASFYRAFETKRYKYFISKMILFLALSYVITLFIWHNPGHEKFKAQSIKIFFHMLFTYLKWPLGMGLWVFWLPTAFFALQFIKNRKAPSSSQWFALCLAGWVGAISVAGSQARAFDYIANRYLSYLIFIFPAVLMLVDNYEKRDKFYTWFSQILKILILVIAIGLVIHEKAGANSRKNASIDCAQMIKESINAELTSPGGALYTLRQTSSMRCGYPAPDPIAAMLSRPQFRKVLPKMFHALDF